MPIVAITYSPEVGGASVISLIKSFSSVDCEVIYADYREMMREIPTEEFDEAYKTSEGRQKLFAHAKKAAEKMLEKVDCLVLSGNTAMIDPNLFNQPRAAGQKYDFSRTVIELALTHVAIQKGMPIMGVCGGHQVIAVYGGGSITDLDPKELDHHRYMNYGIITFNADSTLKKVLEPKSNLNDSLKQEFFGAHFQAVHQLGEGFTRAAIGNDGHIIEVAESEYGAPIITTQFHPEVTLHGLPQSELIFQRNLEERETSLKIFDFFAKAAETYQNKKNLVTEIKQQAGNGNQHSAPNSHFEKNSCVKKHCEKAILEEVFSTFNFNLDNVRKIFRDRISNAITQNVSKPDEKSTKLSENKQGFFSNTIDQNALLNAKKPSQIMTEIDPSFW